MAVDLRPSQPAFFTLENAGEEADGLVEYARSQLGGTWRLLSSGIKLRKTLFEAEFNGRRVFGKISKSQRAHSAYLSMQKLWAAGMRPPNLYTVPEPVAWMEERRLFVQEKAPGASMLEVMQQREDVVAHARHAAAWLRCLWKLNVEAPVVRFDRSALVQRAAELAMAVRDPGIEALAKVAGDVLSNEPEELAPSHGDFHPMNVFVSPERITAIDLDTFGVREREVDVAYFVAQLANFGLHVHGSFEGTRAAREAFFECCAPLNEARVTAHMAWTLLGSVHYDTCILKIPNDKIPTLIDAARQLLDCGSLD